MAQFQQFLSAPGRTLYSWKQNRRQPFTFKQFTFVCNRHRALSCERSGLTMKYHFLIFPSPPPEDTEQAILRAVTEKLISTISRWAKQEESPVTPSGGRHISSKQAACDKQELIVPIRWRSIFVTLSPPDSCWLVTSLASNDYCPTEAGPGRVSQKSLHTNIKLFFLSLQKHPRPKTRNH